MRSFSTIHGIDVLGYGESFHVSGEGFDWMQLANPVADIARTGITYAQKKEADKQSAAAAEKQANASILADRNATLAASRAAYAERHREGEPFACGFGEVRRRCRRRAAGHGHAGRGRRGTVP